MQKPPIKDSSVFDEEEKRYFQLFCLVPTYCWSILGWYFMDLPIEEYKVFLQKLWALPTALTFLLIMFSKIFIIILRGLKLEVTNLIDGRHYLKSNIELSNLAITSNQPIRFMLKSIIFLKHILWAGVGWGTLGALFMFILLQIHGK